MRPRPPNDLHDLLHSVPILLISGEMAQILELQLQCGDFSSADPSIVIRFRDTLFQTEVTIVIGSPL